ncbi:MAG: glycine--tRNA ligase [Candidatus Altiarchaeota archaeon]
MQQKIMELCRRRGIIFPSFEIYGGASGFYDYGPIGVRIKKNLEDILRRKYVIEDGCFEVECPTVTPEKVWIASGHVSSFTDLLTECAKCGESYKLEQLVTEQQPDDLKNIGKVDAMKMLVDSGKLSCLKCKSTQLGKPYAYNLMFKTEIGAGKQRQTGYLRPETAQTIYLPFRRLWEVVRKKLPFGVMQIGHSFRNEISPRQGIVRLREFTQAEVQYFMDPEDKKTESFSEVSALKVRILDKKGKEATLTLKQAVKKKVIDLELMAYHLGVASKAFTDMGMAPEKLRLRQHRDDERAFYSTDTWDVEYESKAYGMVEMVGLSDRTDYDLGQHQKLSGESMEVNIEGRKFVPHVFEVSYGIDRPFYCTLESTYREEGEGEDRRVWFSLPKEIAPYKVAVFPLVKKDKIPQKASEIFKELRSQGLYVLYDEAGSIGKRYARADEIGIPACITIDYDTLKDDTVTVRDRDTKNRKE